VKPRSSNDTPELADTVNADTVDASARSGAPAESRDAARESFGEREVVAERYEVVALLGVGGMGAVYRVKDTRLDEEVALKILRRELVDAPGARQRFLDEVKLARKVTHKNVARTYDIGEHRGGLFLTMELLEGESLGARVEREGALPIAAAIAIAEDVTAGLAAAHAAGVIHRDLKPDNVFCGKDGRAVVTDFGIARAHAANASRAADAARTGGIIGTPAYMAPEQLEGATDLDGRTDLYALGEVLYEMLTGARAWPETDPIASMAARLVRTPPDPRALRAETPAALSEVVARLLARKRDDRFATAADVAKALVAARSTAVSARASVAPPPIPKAAPRGDRTVAVLPLRNEGAPDYVASGLHEDLLDTLSMTRGLRIRPRSVVASIDPRAQASSRALGESLGVQIIVEGSLRAAGSDLRLSMRAIGVDDDFQIWAARFTRPAGEVLALADEAARAIADVLTGELEAPARDAHETAAADLYLRARDSLRNGMHSKESMAEAVALFDAALALAPKDARVLAGAAMARVRHAFFDSNREGQAEAERERARDLAERAIALAPQLAEGWMALANVRLDAGEVVATVRSLHSALRVAPKAAEAREMLAHILLDAGAVDQALELQRGALEIDPTLGFARLDIVRTLALRGDRDEAFDRLMAYAPSTTGEWIMSAWARARYCLWKPDERWKKAALAVEYPREGPLARLVGVFQKCVETGAFSEEDDAFLRDVAESGAQRIRLFARQNYAELKAASGAPVEEVVRAVDLAMSGAAGDVAWLDRCPLFEAARARPEWAAIRARVEEGASKVRAAFFES
jgi:serine/threonine-protein kinase